jgi:hypothetical protein
VETRVTTPLDPARSELSLARDPHPSAMVLRGTLLVLVLALAATSWAVLFTVPT